MSWVEYFCSFFILLLLLCGRKLQVSLRWQKALKLSLEYFKVPQQSLQSQLAWVQLSRAWTEFKSLQWERSHLNLSLWSYFVFPLALRGPTPGHGLKSHHLPSECCCCLPVVPATSYTGHCDNSHSTSTSSEPEWIFCSRSESFLVLLRRERPSHSFSPTGLVVSYAVYHFNCKATCSFWCLLKVLLQSEFVAQSSKNY